MDPQFQELAQHIADDVVQRIDGVVVKRLGEVEQRLGGVIGERLDEAKAHLDGVIGKRLDEAEKRLSEGARIHMEDLKSTIQMAAEGYGVTLERIERRLTELNTKWDTTIGDHDKALKDHAARISALERRR